MVDFAPLRRLRVQQVQPFTYRDGITFLELLERLSTHVKDVLEPSLKSVVDDLVEQFTTEMGEHRDSYVEGVEEFQRIHDAFMSDVNAHLMALNDGAVTDLVNDETSLFGSVMRDVMRDVIRRTVGGQMVVANDPMFGEPYTRQAVLNALDHAESLGKWTRVYFPRGTYELDEGLSLNGYSVQILGDGAGVEFPVGEHTHNYPGVPGGTVFKASNQRGPVLDYRGWVQPESFQGKVEHGNFSVVGSHEPDPYKLNSGIAFTDISSVHFHDIAIRGTGGPGMIGHESPGNAVYLSNFSRIVVDTPVGCKEHDVPYFEFNEANGNVFHNLAIRSRNWAGVGDCGVSGAFRVISNDQFSSRKNVWSETWVEFIHVPTNGTIFHVEAASQSFENTIFWDARKERNAENTSYYRFHKPFTQDNQSNSVTGLIPGAGTNREIEIDYGIIVEQDGLTVSGMKSYLNNHVWLKPGVKDCYIELTGAMINSSGLGVVDDSGNTTNTILDYGRGDLRYGKSDRTNTNIQPAYNGIPNGVTNISEYTLSGTVSVFHQTGTLNVYTLTSDGTLTSPQPGTAVGEIRYILVKQDDVGGHTLAFRGAWDVKNPNPEIHQEPGRATGYTFIWDGGRWVEA